MDVNILRGALVIYGILSAVIIWALWRSAVADNNFSQVATLLGALLVAFIAVAPSMKQDEKRGIVSIVFFRDTESDKLLVGDFKGPYATSMALPLNRVGGRGGPTGMEHNVTDADEIQFLEYVLVEAMLGYIAGSWDSEQIQTPVVHGTGGRGASSFGTDTSFETWSAARLAASLGGNKFIANHSLSRDMQFPMGTTIERSMPGVLGSAIILRTNGFQLTIQIGGRADNTLNEDVWGLLRLQPGEPLKYKLIRYTVMVEGKTDRWNRYPPLIKSYWKWYENTLAAAETVGWSAIDAKILSAESRNAYWKSHMNFWQRAQLWEAMKQQKAAGIAGVTSPPASSTP